MVVCLNAAASLAALPAGLPVLAVLSVCSLSRLFAQFWWSLAVCWRACTGHAVGLMRWQCCMNVWRLCRVAAGLQPSLLWLVLRQAGCYLQQRSAVLSACYELL